MRYSFARRHEKKITYDIQTACMSQETHCIESVIARKIPSEKGSIEG